MERGHRQARGRGKLNLRDCRIKIAPPEIPDVHVGQVIAPVLVIILKCDPKFEPSLQLKRNKCGLAFIGLGMQL